MARVLLIRHGQSEGNAAGVMQGRLDFGLTALGRRQAEAIAARVAEERTPIAAVVSSPLARAAHTAGAIAARLDLAVEHEHGLAEYDIGEASGLTSLEMRDRFPEVFAARRRGEHLPLPGEEGRDLFFERIGAAFERIAHAHGDSTVVAVAHGGVINAACFLALGLAWRPGGLFGSDNCAITEFRAEPGRLALVRHNCVCHLDGLDTDLDLG